MDLILLTTFWVVWKVKNKKALMRLMMWMVLIYLKIDDLDLWFFINGSFSSFDGGVREPY